MIEASITTAYALVDDSGQTRLQLYTEDGQIFQLVLPEAVRAELMINLQRAGRACRTAEIQTAVLIKQQPAAVRADGWDI